MQDNEPGEPRVVIREEVRAKLAFADRIIAGDYGREKEIPEGLDPLETFSGPIIDMQDPDVTEPEVALLYRWVTRHLGSSPEEAPVQRTLRSPDGETEVEVYDVRIGDGWYISRWLNTGEQPTYVFWPEDVYEWQIEAGYEEV